MSTPASLKAGPNTTNTLVLKRYSMLYIILIWLSLLPVLFFVWLTWPGYYYNRLLFFFLLPVYAMLWYILWIADAILFSKLLLTIINLIHKPKEGYFPRDKKNIDYRFWSLRATIKKFAVWATHSSPLPWLDIIAFKLFGVKVGSSTALFDAYVDLEFVEIGNNCIIGQGAVIMGAMITHELLIIKHVKIGNNVVIGAHSVVSPGTIIGDHTTLGGMSVTHVGQELEPNWVYFGIPSRKYRKNEYLSIEESEEEIARKDNLIIQYLTPDEMNSLQEIRIRRKRKQVRTTKRYEKKIEKQEKRLENHEKRLENLAKTDLSARKERKIGKIEKKIEKRVQKSEKFKEKLSELAPKSKVIDDHENQTAEQEEN